MTPTVLSVNVGTATPGGSRGRSTGIDKVPVEAIDVADPGPQRRGANGEGFSGVVGDFIGAGRHHGGTDQAVYAVAREELDHWADELGRDLPNGMFGESITTAGLDVDASEVGDVWRIGGAVLQVTGPRVPCATFARRMGERDWVRRFAARARVGVYLAIVQPGRIAVGDEIHAEPSGSGDAMPPILRTWMKD